MDIMSTQSSERPRRLVTGGSGDVGGRLIALLEQREERVRCLARRPEFLRPRVGPRTEVVAGDVLQPASLAAALEGIETAYSLVHSMGTGSDFEGADREAARNFAQAARHSGVRRIIYLGGLGEQEQALSKHLRSRQEVGHLLRESGAQVVEFRAAIVIGSGSLSFELIRAFVQKLPIMSCPQWISTPSQPIAIEDVLSYLLAALDLPEGPSEIFEIGGPDRLSYGDLMRDPRARAYAKPRNLIQSAWRDWRIGTSSIPCTRSCSRGCSEASSAGGDGPLPRPINQRRAPGPHSLHRARRALRKVA